MPYIVKTELQDDMRTTIYDLSIASLPALNTLQYQFTVNFLKTTPYVLSFPLPSSIFPLSFTYCL